MTNTISSVRCYYDSIAGNDDIDDITWSDLAMDDVFDLLNEAKSSVGEEQLYAMLRKPLSSKEDIEYRDKLITYFQNNSESREAVNKILSKIGRNPNISFYDFFSRLNDVERETNILHYSLLSGWIIGFLLLFANYSIGFPVLGVVLVISIYTYYRRKARIESYYSIFGSVLRLLYCSKKFSKLKIDIISDELEKIEECRKEFDAFKRFSGIVLSPNGGNVLDIVLDYIRIFTHIDLIKFNRMLSVIIDKQDVIMKLHKEVGTLDALICIADYRNNLGERGYCKPEIAADNTLMIKDLYHPLIEKPVYNSITTDEGVLLTGSNASGKSTFLKAVAINQIFVQTIATANAAIYSGPCYHIMTSMALSDDISDNKSYFMVEILSLKRILDYKGRLKVLCCIDEVLRGTNTIERIAASTQILKKLCENNLCFAATHDIELAKLLKDTMTNYHFREKIENDNIIFDYTLYEGSSTTKNAIKLLELLEYDNDIVENAMKLSRQFESTGKWQ